MKVINLPKIVGFIVAFVLAMGFVTTTSAHAQDLPDPQPSAQSTDGAGTETSTPTPESTPEPTQTPTPVAPEVSSVSLSKLFTTLTKADALIMNATVTTVMTHPEPSVASPATVTVSWSYEHVTTKVKTKGTLVLKRVSSTSTTDTYQGTWTRASSNGGWLTVTAGDKQTKATPFPRPVTTISGWSLSNNAKTKAGSSYSNTVTVTSAYGRTLQLQRNVSGKWTTQRTFKTANTATAKVNVTFPASWWSAASTSWRLVAPTVLAASSTTKTKVLKSVPAYVVPKGFVQVVFGKIPLPAGAYYTLKPGVAGIKVHMVQRRLGLPWRSAAHSTANTYGKIEVAAVKKFQKSKKLPVTGNVDQKTWTKMGLSAASWKSYDTFIEPSKINRSTTRAQYIDKMIATAMTYRGTPYINGGAAKQGADCSGLVLQAFYSVGLDPKKIHNVVDHARYDTWGSRIMYNSKAFKHVPLSQRQRGDIIFYRGSNGVVNHVSIYIGNGQIIEAAPMKVAVRGLSTRWAMPQVVRPFP